MASVNWLLSDWNSSTTGSASWSLDADTATFTVWLTGPGSPTISNITNGFNGGCDFGNLNPSSTYTVHLTPTSAGGVDGTTATSSFTTPAGTPPPDALTGLSATGHNGYVHLSWNPSNGATNYNIAWSPGSGFAQTSSTTSDIMGLTNGTSYSFSVTPTNSSGSGGSQTQSATPTSGRPSDFAWTYTTVNNGSDVGMDHRDWNNLTTKIDAFRTYKGLGAFGFTTASVGTFEAFYYRQAVNGINAMTPPTSVPVLHYTGDTVFAADIDRLRVSLNSIV